MWPGDSDNVFNYGLGWDSVKLYPFSEYGIKALAKGGYDAATCYIGRTSRTKMAAAVLSSGGSSMTNQLLANKLLLARLKEKGQLRI